MKKDELIFCPLGGSGEIGGNMNLYAYGNNENQKWIIIDTGVSFADDSVPGIDLIYPDPGFIIDKKDDLLGIVLTHAHEDHIGAISHIWPDLRCNIYATPFTAVLIKEKFKEKKIDINSNLKIVKLNGTIKLGPFDIEFVNLTHSILEPNGLSIKTPAGTVLHTGDWKIDPNPLIGEKINEKKLREIGKNKVLAMICDSTNIFNPGRAGSESDVRHPNREDLKDMYNWVKPDSIIPVHGEHRHMNEHINFAKEMQIPHALRIEDGDVVRIFPGQNPEIIDKAPSGKMYLDGNIAVGENSQSIKERKNLSLNGYLEITLILNNSGKLNKPIISYRGIPENNFDEKIIFEMEDNIFTTCRSFSMKNKNQEKNLIETIKQNCRKLIKEKTGKKPFTNINIARL